MSDLYTIALMFRGSDRQINLTYQSKALAEEVWEELRGLPNGVQFPEVRDDYGTRVIVFQLPEDEYQSCFEAAVFQDSARAMEGGVEMTLLQARAQSKAQSRAQHDPMIKTGGIKPGPLGIGH